jgi:hypothetical protein
MELSSLRREGESLQSRLSRARLLQRSGLRDEVTLAPIYSEFPALSSNDAWALAKETGEGSGEEAQRRARRLAGLVARARLGRAEASAEEERLAFEARTLVRIAGEDLPLRQAWFLVGAELERARRFEVARARDSVLGALDATLARMVDVRQEEAGELGFPSYPALLAHLARIDLGALELEARGLLQSTEDGYRDLLGFGLRKIVGRIAPRPRGEAAEHDLERLRRLQPFDGVFSSRWLLTAARAVFEWIGAPLLPSGPIRLDTESRPHRAPGSFVATLAIPDDLVVVLRPEGGAPDYSELFGALGRARHYASAAPELPFEDRWLGDEAVPEAFGLVFEGFLLDSRFLVKALGADPHEAGEAARFLAIPSLARMRLDCAHLLFELALYKEGPNEELKGFYRETFQKASLCDWPLERWLWDVEPELGSASRLRAWGLAQLLRGALVDRGNEDYWRNPHTNAILRSWSEHGQSRDAGAIASALGAPLSLQRAADQLIGLAAR